MTLRNLSKALAAVLLMTASASICQAEVVIDPTRGCISQSFHNYLQNTYLPQLQTQRVTEMNSLTQLKASKEALLSQYGAFHCGIPGHPSICLSLAQQIANIDSQIRAKEQRIDDIDAEIGSVNQLLGLAIC